MVEEAWLSLTQKKPLYVVGGFGGAARAVSDQLLGVKRGEFDDAWLQQHIPDYDAAVAMYAHHGGEFYSMGRMGKDIEHLQGRIASTLNNGLDEVENRELMASTDPQSIAWLVLTGIGRL